MKSDAVLSERPSDFMKVILLKKVADLGQQGEVKDVSSGFAMNFLFPRKLAELATSKAMRRMAELKQKEEKKIAIKEKPESVAQKLRAITLNFVEKADAKGNFFVGITREKLAAALEARGILVKPKQIRLDSAIKKAGQFTIVVEVAPRLHSEFKLITSVAGS